MASNTPRILIAAMGSGSGKTVLTAVLLRALFNRGLRSAAFKCGPDYIDPQYLAAAAYIKAARNLDAFLCGENNMKYLLAHNSQNKDFAVIEGVMGLYDGIGQTDNCSSNYIARLTATPTILCVAPSGVGFSLAAQIKGFLDFRPNNIKGIIFSRCSEKMLAFYKPMLEAELGIPVYGALSNVDIEISSKHGPNFQDHSYFFDQKLDAAAARLENSVDIDTIIALGRAAGDFAYDEPILPAPMAVKIGITAGVASNFYYEDSFDLLRRLGAELVRIDPVYGFKLPEDISGLILGSGYLEPFSERLQANKPFLTSVQAAIAAGMPVLAEGSGYDYLCRPYASILESDTTPKERAPRFGYVMLTAQHDSMLCREGEQLHAHEYHHSDSSDNGDSFIAKKIDGRSWQCIHAKGNIFAGYPQLHLWGNITFAERFIKSCKEFSR